MPTQHLHEAINEIDLNGLKVRPEDVEYSHYFPKGPERHWAWLSRLIPPRHRGPMLSLELKNRQRYLFEGELADRYADQLVEADVSVFRHEM